MSDDIDWRILDRRIAGEASPEDEAALRRWLERDPRHAELLRAAEAAARTPARGESERFDVDRAWSRVAARMQDGGAGTPVPIRALAPSSRVRRSRRLVYVASSALAAAALALVVWRGDGRRGDSPAAPLARVVAAGNAQQTRVTLGDGTRVVLNAGSRLRYADDYGRTARDVELEGEGYFDVVHDAARPFRVHARGSVAEDVGTRFVVRAYAEQPALEVVVTHGSVAVRHARSTVRALVAAGQRGRIDAGGAVTVVDDADVERWLEWTRGGIVFERVTLAEAAAELQRRFDVRIQVADDALAARRVSGRFHDESLPQVLDALATALGARWTRRADTIVVELAR